MGLSKVPVETQINISPNPASDYIHLQIKDNEGKFLLRIVNLTGLSVMEILLYGGESVLNLSGLSPSIYVVHCIFKDRMLTTKLVIN
jgi:hypothetical protein